MASKFISLILFFIITYQNVYAFKQNFDGEYKNASNRKIIIRQDSLFYLEKSDDHGADFETLLIAQLTNIDNNFMEVNNFENPETSIYKTSSIKQIIDTSNTNDSILINITSKLNKTQFLFSIFDLTNGFNIDTLSFINNMASVKIPKTTEVLIYVQNQFPESEFEGNSKELVSFSFPFRISPKINLVSIDLPKLTSSYFHQLIVKGEYIRVIKNKIYWRGIKFNKLKY